MSNTSTLTSTPKSLLRAHAGQAPTRNAYADLFFISFAVLFLELACIRWFGSAVMFLTFFTNLVLLACFLGMSVGLFAARRKENLVTWVIPLAAIAVGLAELTAWIYTHTAKVAIDVGGQNSPQQVFFGTEFARTDLSQFVVPIEFVAAAFFVAIALMFIGLGQAMGRAFHAATDRVAAYSVDILDSLAGIAAFGAASFLQTPPVVWFAVGIAALCRALAGVSRVQVYGVMAVMVLLATAATRDGGRALAFCSPYYKITYQPRNRMIKTNNIGHQVIVDVRRDGPAYSLPHLLNRDAGGAAFDDVLIVGAGSGNDVAAALWHGVKSVDAVEIAPAIYRLGKIDHPTVPTPTGEFRHTSMTVAISSARAAESLTW